MGSINTISQRIRRKPECAQPTANNPENSADKLAQPTYHHTSLKKPRAIHKRNEEEKNPRQQYNIRLARHHPPIPGRLFPSILARHGDLSIATSEDYNKDSLRRTRSKYSLPPRCTCRFRSASSLA